MEMRDLHFWVLQFKPIVSRGVGVVSVAVGVGDEPVICEGSFTSALSCTSSCSGVCAPGACGEGSQ